MPAKYIKGQRSIFVLKTGRVCLNYWEFAGQLPYMLWRPLFKTFFVYHLKRNILLAGVAEVRALFLLFGVNWYFLLSSLSPWS
jgi:hypothetical protein